jgi:ubiquinol oxidase
MFVTTPLERHYAPEDLADRVASALTRLLRFFADAFFARRYGHRIAIEYWKLAPEARLRGVIVAVRADEARHRDVNHGFADELA